MRLYLFVACILCCTWSCNQQDPYSEVTGSYYFYKSGDGQLGVAGEYLENELWIECNFSGTEYLDELQVHFEVTSGGGSVDSPHQTLSYQPILSSSSVPIVSTKWKTGFLSKEQTVTAHIYGKNRKHLTDIVFSSTVYQFGNWDLIGNIPVNFYTMAKDMVNNKTYIIRYGRLHVMDDFYFDQWNIVASFEDKSCNSIKVDSKGILYAVTENGELFISTDQGLSFVSCGKPFTNFNYPFYLHITNNDYLWAINDYYWSEGATIYPWRYSADGGLTWISTDFKRNSNQVDIFSFTDNSYMSVDWNNQYILFQSMDGTNWLQTSKKLPEHVMGMFVTERDEIILYGQVGASIVIYKSTDFLTSFSQVYSVPIEWSGGNYVEKYKDSYYFSFSGGGIFRTKDFETFEIVWSNESVFNLMIDHNGVLYAAVSDPSYSIYCLKEKE